jgi:hypothetical protein
VARFQQDPKDALLQLAKSANVDLGSGDSNSSDDAESVDEYLTPEELAMDKKMKTLEARVQQFENQTKQQDLLSAQQEVEAFRGATDTEGNLKHPHFERVRSNMSKLFNIGDNDMTFEKAYQRAILLDDELVEQRDLKIKDSFEKKRKADVVKAKKAKRQSVRTSKISSTSHDPLEMTRRLVAGMNF